MLIAILLAVTAMFSFAGPVKALQGVGALADQVANGDEIRVIGKTAPLSEVNVVVKTDDHITAVAEVEKSGDFDIRFKLKGETVNELQIFDIDDFGVTRRAGLPEVSSQRTVLLPPTIVNDKTDSSVTEVALTGRTYPLSKITLTVTGPENTSAVVTADQTGRWEYKNENLRRGKYTATAVSASTDLVSQKSQEIFFEIQGVSVPVVSKLPLVTFSVWWWLPLILTIFEGWPLNIWSAILRLIYSFLYLFGWHKQRRKWGVVYDSVAKSPIAGAIVRLYRITNNELRRLEMTITDRDGEFLFMPNSGKYVIKVSKGGYVFPSVVIKGGPPKASLAIGGGSDGEYINQYHGEDFEVAEGAGVTVSIAMDRIGYRVSLWNFLGKYLGLAWKVLGWCLIISGTILAIRIWLSSSSWPDGLVTVVYMGLIIWNLVNGVDAFRKSSRVTERPSGRGVSFANVEVYEATSGALVQRRVSDQRGYFILRLPQGSYRVVISAVDHVWDRGAETVEVRGEGTRDVRMVLKMRAK